MIQHVLKTFMLTLQSALFKKLFEYTKVAFYLIKLQVQFFVYTFKITLQVHN